MVCNQTGALEAWEHPKDEALLETWNLRVGKHSPHRISKSEMKGELFTTVKRLVCASLCPLYPLTILRQVKQNGIAVWQNKIATKAKDAVMAEWKIRRLETVKDRADFALAMLGPDPTDLSKKDRPFLWQSTDESFEAEREVCLDLQYCSTLTLKGYRACFKAGWWQVPSYTMSCCLPPLPMGFK